MSTDVGVSGGYWSGINEESRGGARNGTECQGSIGDGILRQHKDSYSCGFTVLWLYGFVVMVRETVEFVRRVESVGVDFISVHGRLKSQRSSTPPNLDAIALVKSTVQCPVVANGDVYSLKDVGTIVEKTNVDGMFPVDLTEIRCDGGAGVVGESRVICWT